MSRPLMPRADFITALIFFILGIFMIVEGLGMPGQEEVAYIELGGEPGRVPIVLGAIIAVFSLVLLLRAASEGGYKLFNHTPFDERMRTGIRRTTITGVMCSFYAIGLLGADIVGWDVQFHEATALFMFAFIVFFEWSLAPESGAKRWASVNNRFPGLAGFLKSVFGFIPAEKAPYVWMMVTASLQSVLATWVITYLFEKEFFVTLP